MIMLIVAWESHLPAFCLSVAFFFFFHINNYFILHSFFFFFSFFKVRLRDFNISEVSKHPWQWVLNKDSWAVENAAFSVKVKLLWACFYAAADPFKNRDKFAAWILKGHATVSLEHFIGSVHVCYRIQGNLLCSNRTQKSPPLKMKNMCMAQWAALDQEAWLCFSCECQIGTKSWGTFGTEIEMNW